jgi:mycothiol synthase
VTADETVLTWRSGLDEKTAGALRALLDAATTADGTAPVSENVLLHLRRDLGSTAAHLLARDPATDRLVGYAYLDSSNPAEAVGELAVHPAERRQGIGTALVTELVARAGEDGGRLRLWAHGEHPAAVRLATGHGFRQVRTLWQMRRGLREQIPAATFPPGVRLRAFVVGQDEAEFLRVNNAAFDWHPEQGGWDIEQVKLREAEPWFDADGFLLAVETDPDSGADGRDRLLGYHWTKVHPAHAGEPPIGEVYVLGVDPAAQGRKLGAALTVAGLRYLRERGLDDVMLYVEADNHAAVKVYQRLGFAPWHTDAAFLR